MFRRVEIQDIEDTLQRQTWYLAPQRYNDLFFAGEFEPDPLTMAGRDVEEVVDDVDELDAYFNSLEEKRSMSGNELFGSLTPDAEGWI